MTKKEIEEEFCNSLGKLIGKKVKKSNHTKEALTALYHECNIKCKCGRDRKMVSFKEGFKNTCSSRECPFWIKETYDKVKETKKKNGTLQNSKTIIDKSKKTKLIRYGDENYVNSDKAKKTSLERYGVTSFTKTKEYIEKSKSTRLEKYGDENYVNTNAVMETKAKNGTLPSSEKVIQKGRETKKKNGSFRNSNKVQDKIKNTKKLNYGSSTYNNSDKNKHNRLFGYLTEVLGLDIEMEERFYDDYNYLLDIENKHFLDNLDKYSDKKGVISKLAAKYLSVSVTKVYKLADRTNTDRSNRSFIELELLDLTDDAITSRKIIAPFELDMYSRKFNFAIEYNGVYWHAKKDKEYHLNKTERCKAIGINLFHIFDTEWLNPIKKEIWLSKINTNIEKVAIIGASKCTLRVISQLEAKDFMRINHLEEYTMCNEPNNINLGLYHEDVLVSAAVFLGNEILQITDKVHLSIKGSYKILTEYYLENYDRHLLTISMNRRFDETVFEEIGFIVKGYTDPERVYMKIIDDSVYDCGRVVYRKDAKENKNTRRVK